jgi:hypothetical protein
MPLRRDLPFRPAGQEGLVRDPQNGKVHFLNATASVIWECCDGETTVAECERRLRTTFVIPADAAVGDDIREVVRDFGRRGLLEERPA